MEGKIVEINHKLVENPEVVNLEPYGAGWLIKVQLSDSSKLDELMDAATYESTLE